MTNGELNMKVSKIPGLGRFGVFIDDIDLNTITDEEWMAIGQIHLESLVTIIRAPKIDHHRYAQLMVKWGPWRYNSPIQYFLKYGKPLKDVILAGELDPADQITLANGRRWQVDKRYPGMVRITPRKNRRGESMGLFGDGERLGQFIDRGRPAGEPGDHPPPDGVGQGHEGPVQPVVRGGIHDHFVNRSLYQSLG